MQEKGGIRFSVIIPVHNREDYIENAINSILNQSFSDFEIICVDDCSDDRTTEIVKELQKKDNRIVLIELSEASSAFIARKRGIERARGEYILFLDSDDCFSAKGLEIADKELKKAPVDILHFSSEVVNAGTDSARVEMNQKLVAPYVGELKGENVFLGCFRDNKYKFTIWNKAFSADVCKKAMAAIDDGVYMKANDLMLFFPVALYAKSYRGVKTKPVYRYFLGRGSTGKELLSYEGFTRYCALADAVKGLYEFAAKSGITEKYGDILKKLEDSLLKDCMNNWYKKVDMNASARAFDLMCEKWGAEAVLNAFGEAYGVNAIGELALKVKGSEMLGVRDLGEVKTIGVYYLRMRNGGVQRVISLLLPLYIKMGYRVVLFTDEYFPGEEYDIPEEVIRVIVPVCTENGKVHYAERAKVFREAIEEYGVKLMLYQAASVNYLVYDFLFFKSLGLNFILTKHEYSTNALTTMSPMFHRRFEVFKIIDVITVLSRTDEVFLRLMGANAVYVPNIIENYQRLEKLGNEILWLGRLELSSKQYTDIPKIISVVKQTVPDVKCLFACAGTEKAMENLKETIENYEVSDNIEVVPFINDVERYYSRAKIHLLTSVTESFPMTVVESKSYGIPLVLYELPYIELFKDGKGYVPVAQKDIFGAAAAIIKILQDEEYCNKLSDEAAESIEPFRNYDFFGVWGDIIKKISSGDACFPESQISREEMSYLLENIASMYKIGCAANEEKLTALRKEKKKYRKRMKHLEKQRGIIYKGGSLLKRILKKLYKMLKG